MSNLSKAVVALVGCASMLCVTAPAVAAGVFTVGDYDTSWPTDPALETFDPTGNPASSGLGTATGSGRVIGQSFRVQSPTRIGNVFFEFQYFETNAGAFTLRLHEVADTTISGNNDPQLGAVLAEGEGLLGLPNSSGAETVIRLDLDKPITLSPQAGTAGYAFIFSDAGGIIPSTHPTLASFPLVEGSIIHVPISATQKSLAFAFEIPEPTSLSLLGLGGMLMLRRRKHA